jgi:cell division septal protein FtsQ
MNTRRWIVIGAVAVLLTSSAATAPELLRRFDSFHIERVEIRGTRYMTPYDALVQSGITKKSSVFDDFEPWRARLLQHPMILDATIDRQLPGTVRIEILETEPVALARTPELRLVDARARALPIDPTSADLDVPLVSVRSHPNAKGLFADAATTQVITVLATLKQQDARLYSWVSEASPLRDHGVRLELRTPLGAEARVALNARTLRLHELQLALADLAARGELPRLQRIDARFHDQIVVALTSATRSGPDSAFPVHPAERESGTVAPGPNQ